MMAKLSDLQLASLLEEIACCMRAGTPIIDSMQRLSECRLGSITRAARRIEQALSRGQDLPQAMQTIGSPLRLEIAAAVEICQRNGDADLLTRIAQHLRQRSEDRRSMQVAWAYPWLLLAIMFGIIVWVVAPMMQNQNGLNLSWPLWLRHGSQWLESNTVLAGSLLLLSFTLCMIWMLTRKRFPKPVRLRLFCQSLADQMDHDVADEVAIKTAAAMCGDRELLAIENPSLQSPPVAQMLAQTGTESIAKLGQKELLIASLRYAAATFADRARHRDLLLTCWIPRTAMIVVGGGFTLAYAWWVIGPIYLRVGQ
ncbi:MAG: type II secretion system F family protein [Pirellulales bacterium]|nr:type II secretion system F family protein [Pirellulales bacterium]